MVELNSASFEVPMKRDEVAVADLKLYQTVTAQLPSKLDKLKKTIHVTRSLDVVSKSRKSPS